MTLFKSALAALTVTSGLFICASNSAADEWNKKTIVTIDEAIQLPNAVLQPGTYVFKLLDSQSDRHIVQVFNKEESLVITTILAIPNYRLQPKGKSVFTFWEVPAGETPSVRAWFYPGDLFGQEFAYPKNRAIQVAAFTKTSIPTSNAQSVEEMSSAPIGSMDQNGQTSELDQREYLAKAEPAPSPSFEPTPAPEPLAAAPVTPPAPVRPEPAPEPLPQELPHTGSQMPLIGLTGLASLVAFCAMKRLDRSASSQR